MRKKETQKRMLNARELLDGIGIEAICEHVESGESLLNWCEINGFKYTVVGSWIDASIERKESYARAREARADHTFESLDEISRQAIKSDNAVEVAGLRLAADNTKWKLARMSARYSDKQTIDLNANIVELTDEQRKDRLAELLAKSGK